ncbi:Gfo/Idh/MocA family oxidoreductase [Halobaculum sp. MBLA0147]|uniref:Gfo/Idh/MocA family protein n=1 Tax=Halobaculum sp. MBLA0147 TaxID=3079934 RepID=UPI00352652F9
MSTSDLLAGEHEPDWDTGVDGTVAVAVVGLGGYARGVSLPALAAGGYTTVGAVVSGDPEKAATVADEYGATALTYDDYAAGEATDAYDAVYVATPNRDHLQRVETAAAHGRHAIVEKPLDATSERAAAAVDACEAADVRLMTAYRMQTDPVIRRLRTAVDDGFVGDAVKLFGDFTFPVLRGSAGPDQWRLDPHLAGGGALYDVGVYPLNTARFLLDADPVAVSATLQGGNPRADGDGSDAGGAGAARDDHQSTADPFVGVDEHTHFQVSFPDGVVGNFSASFTGHATAALEVIGTAGRVRIEDAFQPGRDRVVRVERGEETVTLEGVGGDETRAEFDYFAHAILADEPIEPDGHDGLVDLHVLEAVLDAAHRGERVSVPERET